MSAGGPRLTRGGALVVASHNAGKVREIRELLAPFAIETVSAGDLGLPEPDETEETFEGNAALKARAAAIASGKVALADDSGLEIDCLDGRPGVRTADWAETPAGRDFAMAMARAEREVAESGAAAPFAARFVCVLCLAAPDGATAAYRGTVEGAVSWPPRGALGFGYDPIFTRRGETRTFGEMSRAEKQEDDHRSDAFGQLVAASFGDEKGDGS